MRSSSVLPSMSNRQSSTLLACAENSAKLTPTPSQVAPSGNEWPSRTRGGVLIWSARTAGLPRAAFPMSLSAGRLRFDQPAFVRQRLPHLARGGGEVALAPGFDRLGQQGARKGPARQPAQLGRQLAVDH